MTTPEIEAEFKANTLALKIYVENALEDAKITLEQMLFEHQPCEMLQRISVVVLGLQIALDGLNNRYDYFKR